MSRQTKRVAWITALIATTVLVALFVAIAPIAIDEWYIRQLDAPEESLRLDAVQSLGERRCRRAAPFLVEAHERERNVELRLEMIDALMRIDRLDD